MSRHTEQDLESFQGPEDDSREEDFSSNGLDDMTNEQLFEMDIDDLSKDDQAAVVQQRHNREVETIKPDFQKMGLGGLTRLDLNEMNKAEFSAWQQTVGDARIELAEKRQNGQAFSRSEVKFLTESRESQDFEFEKRDKIPTYPVPFHQVVAGKVQELFAGREPRSEIRHEREPLNDARAEMTQGAINRFEKVKDKDFPQKAPAPRGTIEYDGWNNSRMRREDRAAQTEQKGRTTAAFSAALAEASAKPRPALNANRKTARQDAQR